jgi:hypothetical protein
MCAILFRDIVIIPILVRVDFFTKLFLVERICRHTPSPYHIISMTVIINRRKKAKNAKKSDLFMAVKIF